MGKALYHYVSNSASMTNVPKPKHLIELKYNSDRVLSFWSNVIMEHGVKKDIRLCF